MQNQRRKEVVSITMEPHLAEKAMLFAVRRGQSRSAFISELVQRAVQQEAGGDQRPKTGQQQAGKDS